MAVARRAVLLIAAATALLLLPYWQSSSSSTPRLVPLSGSDPLNSGPEQFDALAFASELYSRYGEEIAALVPVAKAFCKKPGVQCLSNDLESELYGI